MQDYFHGVNVSFYSAKHSTNVTFHEFPFLVAKNQNMDSEMTICLKCNHPDM